jgi:hypothetical protein
MARWIGALNEGSLLRRTALHVGTFVLGSLTFVTLVSVLLVSIATAILPPHTAEGARAEAAEEADGTDGAVSNKNAPAKARTRRPRSAPPAEPAENDSAQPAD